MNQDWLTQLAPAHAPAAVGWWPPAPGWWVLAVLGIALMIVAVRMLRDPRRALRRAAMRQLQVIRASDADGAAVARATQNLIRRYALAVFGRERVARLTGEAWLNFVMNAGGDALAGAPGRSMLAAAFGNSTSDDRDAWIAGAEGFIKRAAKARPAHRPRDPLAHASAGSAAPRPNTRASSASSSVRVSSDGAPGLGMRTSGAAPTAGPSARASGDTPTAGPGAQASGDAPTAGLNARASGDGELRAGGRT